MEFVTRGTVFRVAVLRPTETEVPSVMVFGTLIFVRDTGSEAENIAIATRAAEAALGSHTGMYRSQHNLS